MGEIVTTGILCTSMIIVGIVVGYVLIRVEEQ